ncbi:MAG: multidrug ABC transporter [Ectothiorhodospiraceae bacterium]|nr:multidrug ABC transporter [Ectothiorhodospiraceae bacterium]
MNTVLRILGYLKPYKKNITFASICMLFFVAFNMATIVLIIPFINVLFGNEDIVKEVQPEFSIGTAKDWAVTGMNNLIVSVDVITALQYLCLLILGSFVLKNLFHYMQIWFMAPAEQGIIRDIRMDMYTHVNKLSLAYFAEEKKGQLMSRIINDAKLVNDSALSVVHSIFRDPPTILGLTIMLLLLDWQLTLIVFLVLPITGVILAKIGDYLKRKSHKMQEAIADLTAVLEEGLSNTRIIKAFRMEKYEIAKYHKYNEEFYKTHVKIHRRKELYGPFTETLSVLIVVLILWFMGSRILTEQTDMSSGQFVAYVFAMLQLMAPLKAFGQMISGLATGMAGAQRIFSILDVKPSIGDKPDAVTLERFTDRIVYRDVQFRYSSGEPVFTNLNAEIQYGQIVAIVGPSGIGKSTMVDLLPRFYDVTGGSISIDGKDIRDVTLDSLRGLMGIVTQETMLFNASIRENIAYGDDTIPMERIEEAARAANAHDFILETPNGYDTVIGDRGTKLSGGQRQRLSIARAILKNPPILILDEATSSLDTESELLVQNAIERLIEGRTAIVIAHRLSTIQRADKILVLGQGGVLEEGRHDELMQHSGGAYKRLYDLQFAFQ